MPVTSISDMFGVTSRIGMELRGSNLLARPVEYIGVELELEQADLNLRGDRIRWPQDEATARALIDTHNDGSLRNGIELVFRQPLFGQQALAAIDTMFEIKQINNLTDSVRTSTHVHINYSDVGAEVVTRVAALNAIVEPYIVGTAGTHREANCYAVSMRGSDFLTHRRVNYNVSDFVINQTGSHRYLGFNMAALAKYGTIEYRYFGGLDRNGVVALVNMLLEQKTMALSSVNFLAIVEQYDTIRDFIFNELPHAAAFLKLDSVSREDDIAWRDEVLLRLQSANAFCSAFNLDTYDEETDEEVPEPEHYDEPEQLESDPPGPEDAVFTRDLNTFANQAGIDRYTDLLNRAAAAAGSAGAVLSTRVR